MGAARYSRKMTQKPRCLARRLNTYGDPFLSGWCPSSLMLVGRKKTLKKYIDIIDCL
jgi:hypothetical protein